MASRHYATLKKRYRNVDFVAEYRNHWAQFNAWFNSEFEERSDRKSIERLKKHTKLRKTIKSLSIARVDRFLRHEHRYIKEYLRYRRPTVVADFVRAAFENRRFVNALNLFDRLQGGRVRPTYTIHLPLSHYRRIHSHFATMEASSIGITESYGHSELLRDRGITAYGGLLSRGVPRRIGRNKRAGSAYFWQLVDADPTLERASKLSHARRRDSLCDDVIEMMYLARNLAVHGVLDASVHQHNEIARTALQLLDRVVGQLTK